MEKTSPNRFLSWGIFIALIVLVIWGLVAAQKKAAREEASLVLPTQITELDHSRGSTTAPVTLVEYGDFQCPACAAYHSVVEQIVKEIGSTNLRMVFRHFPLQMHANAMPAAQATEAAAAQGKFWEMYSMIYERQKSWENVKDIKTVFIGYADEIGLDTEKFAVDYELDSVHERINLDYKGGVKAGVSGTPTFFINGKQIQNPRDYDDFKKIIHDALKTSTTTTQ